MSEAIEQTRGHDPLPARIWWRLNPRYGLMTILAGGAAAGLAFLLYLAWLPSDPEGALVGRYSLSRIGLLSGMGTVMLACGILAGILLRRPNVWERWSQWFYRPGGGARTLGSVAVAVAGLLGLGVTLAFPEWISELNTDRMARLGPFLAWPAIVALLTGLSWWLVNREGALRLSGVAGDRLIFVGLVLVSVLFRAPMTDYALPYQAVWDEVVTYSRALETLDPDPILPEQGIPGYGHSSYGDFLVGLTASAQAVGLFIGLRDGQVLSLREYLSPAPGIATIFEGVHHSGLPLLLPRLLFVLLNSCAPGLIFIGMRRHFSAGRPASVVAGLIYAVLSRDVIYYSSFILPDALATTLTFGAILVWLGEIDTTGYRPWPPVFAGGLIGLAVATAFRYVPLAAMIFLALPLAPSGGHRFRRGVAALSGMAGGLILGSPGFLLDLPGQLLRVSSLTWYHDTSWQHRLESLVYYARGMFAPGFASGYVDSTTGSVGFGPVVAVVAIVGLAVLLSTRPRSALFLVLVGTVHLWAITPVVQRFTRHALVLYPLVCLLAGIGLQATADGLATVVRKWGPRVIPPRGVRQLADRNVIEVVVVGLFLVATWRQAWLSYRYVQRTSWFETPQARMESFLAANLPPESRVGVLDRIPWDERALWESGVDFVRVGLTVTGEELVRQGIDYVVGTDRLESEYGSVAGTIWARAFDGSGDRLAEFGSDRLIFAGYPQGNLYLFLAEVRGD